VTNPATYWHTFIMVPDPPFNPDRANVIDCWTWCGDVPPGGVPRYRPGPGPARDTVRVTAAHYGVPLDNGIVACKHDVRCVNPWHAVPHTAADLAARWPTRILPCGHDANRTGETVRITPRGTTVRECLPCTRHEADREHGFARALLNADIHPDDYRVTFNRRTENPWET